MSHINRKRSFGSEVTSRFCRNVGIILGFATFFSLGLSTAWAGGGPENVFVVVNPRSWASKAIANHYVAERDIPAINVFELPWTKSNVVTDVTTFRDEILKPILAEINRRKLGGQIDYIAYSADFPYRIEFSAELAASPDKVLGLAKRFPSGSLTGMTYLAPLTLAKLPATYTGLNSNWYFRPFADGELQRPTRAFHSRNVWDVEGEVVEEGGLRYIGCTMLGYTSGRGNSVAEVVDSLERSVAADEARPTGTVYFCKNADIRSATRDKAFPAVADQLTKLGVKGEIITGIMPTDAKDVAGAVMGSAGIDWAKANNTVLPGAICEHLTSLGGVLHEDGGQTPISVLVRGGATGSSGTVIEPFALQQKFPHPAMHLHYAAGCNLAESFYQAVQAPYQLLILGDPLCQPWARQPKVTLADVESHDQVSGKMLLKPKVELHTDQKLKHVELFLDGQRIAILPPDKLEFELDTKLIADGYHELRLVAVEDSLIEVTGRLILPLWFNNHDLKITVSTAPLGRVYWNQKVTLSAHAPGAEYVYFLRGVELLGGFEGRLGTITIDASALGMGPTEVRAIAIHGGEEKQKLFSEPIKLNVLPARPLEGEYVEAPDELVAGLELTRQDGTKTVVERMKGDAWYQAADVRFGESIRLSGYTYVEEPGLYQVQAEFAGEVTLRVGPRVLISAKSDELDYQYAPVQLNKGWHQVVVNATTIEKGRLRLYFGKEGAQTFDGDRFKHAPFEPQARLVESQPDSETDPSDPDGEPNGVGNAEPKQPEDGEQPAG